MLIWIDDLRNISDVPRTRKKFFYDGKARLDADEYQTLVDYMNSVIDKDTKNKEFIVPGWDAPGSWENLPLQIIWEKVYPNDFESCAKWYGLLTMAVMIDRPETWYATKTDFGNNKYEKTTYWQKKD